MANREGGRVRLLAIEDILKKFTDEDVHLNAEQIKKILSKDYQIEADRRSIRKDIEALKEMELAEDASKYAKMEDRGSSYTAHPFETWELKMLLDGVAQTDYFAPATLDDIIDRIIALGGPSSKELLKENRPILDYEVDHSDYYLSYNLDTLTKAIQNKQQVKFKYFKLNGEKKRELHSETEYQVHPYLISKRGAHYYLITYMEGDTFIRSFRMDRIGNAEILPLDRYPANRLPIIGDRTDEMRQYLRSNTDSFTGDRISVEIIWEDEPSILFDVFGVSNVSLTDKNKYVIKTMVNQGLYNNLLRLGSKLYIISPASVKEQYVKTIENIFAKYK